MLIGHWKTHKLAHHALTRIQSPYIHRYTHAHIHTHARTYTHPHLATQGNRDGKKKRKEWYHDRWDGFSSVHMSIKLPTFHSNCANVCSKFKHGKGSVCLQVRNLIHCCQLLNCNYDFIVASFAWNSNSFVNRIMFLRIFCYETFWSGVQFQVSTPEKNWRTAFGDPSRQATSVSFSRIPYSLNVLHTILDKLF